MSPERPSLLRNRPVFGWALYDWANSAFATTVMAGFFPAFFKDFWSVGAEATVTTFRLGLANGLAGATIAVLAPLLGAMADRGGRRKGFLAAFTALGIAATAALWFVGQGDWGTAALLFGIGSLGFMGANVFYDSLLLDVAAPAELDRTSSFGYALGYLGGGLLFAFNVLMVLKPGWFGLSGAAEAVRASFLMVAVWWLAFSLPLLRWVQEAQPPTRLALIDTVPTAIRGLIATVRAVRGYRAVWLFLIAYWLYIDGVNTVIKMAVDFGLSLGLPSSALLTALLLTQFVAFPASLLFGYLGDRIGAKRGILLGLAVYTLATLAALGLDTIAEFYGLAVAIGLVQGGVQSLSRSYFGRLIPPGRNAEFFGFYNMMGKFASVIGPLLVGVVALYSGSSQLAVASLVVLFIGGAVVLMRVPG